VVNTAATAASDNAFKSLCCSQSDGQFAKELQLGNKTCKHNASPEKACDCCLLQPYSDLVNSHWAYWVSHLLRGSWQIWHWMHKSDISTCAVIRSTTTTNNNNKNSNNNNNSKSNNKNNNNNKVKMMITTTTTTKSLISSWWAYQEQCMCYTCKWEPTGRPTRHVLLMLCYWQYCQVAWLYSTAKMSLLYLGTTLFCHTWPFSRSVYRAAAYEPPAGDLLTFLLFLKSSNFEHVWPLKNKINALKNYLFLQHLNLSKAKRSKDFFVVGLLMRNTLLMR